MVGFMCGESLAAIQEQVPRLEKEKQNRIQADMAGSAGSPIRKGDGLKILRLVAQILMIILFNNLLLQAYESTRPL